MTREENEVAGHPWWAGCSKTHTGCSDAGKEKVRAGRKMHQRVLVLPLGLLLQDEEGEAHRRW